MILQASLSDQIAGWFPSLGAVLFYLVVWGLVFAGTGLFIGALSRLLPVTRWSLPLA